jgi:hypothetical protein
MMGLLFQAHFSTSAFDSVRIQMRLLLPPVTMTDLPQQNYKKKRLEFSSGIIVFLCMRTFTPEYKHLLNSRYVADARIHLNIKCIYIYSFQFDRERVAGARRRGLHTDLPYAKGQYRTRRRHQVTAG